MFGRRHRHHKQEHRCTCPLGKQPPCPLSDCPEQARAHIITNPDRQTLELGIYPGAVVRVCKNHPGDPNLIVGVGDSRFILDRTLARKILVG